jgi:predicted nucleotidyltransferase
MVIGGQAVLLYGEPRFTNDIDITIGLDIDKLDLMLEIIDELKLDITVKDIHGFVSRTMVLPAVHKKSNIRLDFIFSNSEYEKSALKRTKNKKINGIFVRYCSLEDLIIHKIIAGRPRDIEDIRVIVTKNPRYDQQYIKKWLTQIDKSLDTDYYPQFQSAVAKRTNQSD